MTQFKAKRIIRGLLVDITNTNMHPSEILEKGEKFIEELFNDFDIEMEERIESMIVDNEYTTNIFSRDIVNHIEDAKGANNEK